MILEPGTIIGHYQVIEKLGEGGMGAVYRVFDTQLERYAALKVVKTDRLSEDNIDFRLKRFNREARAMAQLNHPNIAHIDTYGEYEGQPFFVMELLSSFTLRDLMAVPMPAEKAIDLLLPIIDAVSYAHQRNILHRDLKPSNIIFRDNTPVLTDFGLAKINEDFRDGSLSEIGPRMGTLNYMSPEQAMGLPIDGRSDEFSLAVILFEMITGFRPYGSESQESDKKRINRIFIPDMSLIPEKLRPVLSKALARSPENRFPTVQDFAGALQQYPDVQVFCENDQTMDEATRETAAAQYSVPEGNPQAEKTKRINKMLFYAAAGLVILAVVYGIYHFQIFIPSEQYSRANKLMIEGEYRQAADLFVKNPNYKDSLSRIEFCENMLVPDQEKLDNRTVNIYSLPQTELLLNDAAAYHITASPYFSVSGINTEGEFIQTTAAAESLLIVTKEQDSLAICEPAAAATDEQQKDNKNEYTVNCILLTDIGDFHLDENELSFTKKTDSGFIRKTAYSVKTPQDYRGILQTETPLQGTLQKNEKGHSYRLFLPYDAEVQLSRWTASSDIRDENFPGVDLCLGTGDNEFCMYDLAVNGTQITKQSFFLPVGFYIVRLEREENIDVNYEMEWSVRPKKGIECEPNDTKENATPVVFGQQYSGILWTENDIDYYSFDMKSFSEITIDFQAPLKSGNQTTFFEIMLDDSVQYYDILPGNGTEQHKSWKLDTGNHYLKIKNVQAVRGISEDNPFNSVIPYSITLHTE